MPTAADSDREVTNHAAMPTAADPSHVAAALAAWYPAHHRRLPWRDDLDPFHVWVSEVLLQQTRVETVLARWGAFWARFPDIDALAAAGLDDVLKAWEGLGYYTRARNLHRAAGIVVREHGGRFPDDFEAATALPGVGRSTAGAILSIAYGRALPVLDGNVARVLVRLDAVRQSPAAGTTAKGLWVRADALVRAAPDPGMHNQAMMELGATVCVLRVPRCDACPLAVHCQGRADGIAADLPVRKPKVAVPQRRFVAGIVVHAGRVLVVQRPAGGLLGGLWAFPGLHVEPGQASEPALQAHLALETGARVVVGDRVGEIRHAYTHFRETVEARVCTPQGVSVPACGPVGRWVTRGELDALAMPRAHRRLVELAAFPLPSDPRHR
jgi:A/G-specific adenine glycosylase